MLEFTVEEQWHEEILETNFLGTVRDRYDEKLGIFREQFNVQKRKYEGAEERGE